jgi:GT2 family glycosyltransferase
MSRSLAVCIVVYHSDVLWLRKTLASLRAAIDDARAKNLIDSVDVCVVDNGANESATPVDVSASVGARSAIVKSTLDSTLWPQPSPPGTTCTAIAPATNIGFGAANNAALKKSQADYLLILNPDVELATGVIANALIYFDQHTGCGAVTPIARSPDGTAQFLVKRDPTLFALALRGFAPAWVKRAFSRALGRYEYRDLNFDAPLQDCRVVSGCWLMVRGEVWRQIGGFDESFFLYFEDFDLSQRLARVARIDRVPSCRIVHAGGNASGKGLKHVALFVRSAIRYFNKHGWRWV